MTLQAVLWDMDGTMVRTEELWVESEERTMAKLGSVWTAQDSAVAIGGPLDRVAEYMAERVGRSTSDVAQILVDDIEELMASREIPWMPGAAELHEDLIAAGVAQALVSNSWRELMDSVLDRLDTVFDVVIAGDEVARPKPDPMPYVTASRLLGASTSQTVVLEDSPTGVRSALAAGCAVVGVPQDSELPEHPRLTVVDSLAKVDVQMLRSLVA